MNHVARELCLKRTFRQIAGARLADLLVGHSLDAGFLGVLPGRCSEEAVLRKPVRLRRRAMNTVAVNLPFLVAHLSLSSLWKNKMTPRWSQLLKSTPVDVCVKKMTEVTKDRNIFVPVYLS